MTTTNSEQLRREIELTQRGLSADVNALTEKVTPRRIVQRRVSRARGRFASLRDTVMGTASEATDRMGSTASSVADNVTSTASSVADNVTSTASSVADSVTSAGQRVGETPRMVRHQTQGNPLAAGLIAFGVGWLTASLLPPSTREQAVADQAKDLAQEHIRPAVGQVAEQVKDNLKQPAQHAVESVRATAQDAGSTVAEETRGAAEDIKDRAQNAAGKVNGEANSASS
ncbi:MAG: DUF3618 domain-containing protein [Labedaea sp.]